MTINTANDIPGQCDCPDPETLKSEARKQADAVIALRRLLAEACTRKELRVLSTA